MGSPFFPQEVTNKAKKKDYINFFNHNSFLYFSIIFLILSKDVPP